MPSVLVCGMTSQQTSQKVAQRTRTFASDLCSLLELCGTSVTWQDPGMAWTTKDFKAYDKVIVGVSPVLSLSANKAYPALMAINSLWRTDKLVLFIDAPEPGKIHASARSVLKDTARLVKTLYSGRKGYAQAVGDSVVFSKLVSSVELLHSEPWPKTLVPGLPWGGEQFFVKSVPEQMAKSFTCIETDALYDKPQLPIISRRNKVWTVENLRSKWATKTTSHVTFPVQESKSSRIDRDVETLERLATSWGTIIGPHDDKILWWSPRFTQSMSVGTPVVTEWRKSMLLGDSWQFLAATVEQMSQVDAYELSAAQATEYFRHLPSKDQLINTTKTLIGV